MSKKNDPASTAQQQAPEASQELTKARALIDLHEFGYPVRSGQFFVGPANIIEVLARDGAADTEAREKDVFEEDIPEPICIGMPPEKVEA